jgi:hypothetical protein
MRLAGVTNITEGNAFLDGYLPEYNRKFAKETAQKADFHRPVVNKKALDTILAIKTDRSLRNDFTVAHDKKLYQIRSNIRAKKVTVEERTDGSMRMTHNGQKLRFHEIFVMPIKEKKTLKELKPLRVWKPSDSHPWKSRTKALIEALTELHAIS